MADQPDPDVVGATSPLFGFGSSDVVSAIPHCTYARTHDGIAVTGLTRSYSKYYFA